MTLTQLKQLYRIGELSSARIMNNPSGGGYLLELKLVSGATVPMIKTRTGPDNTHSVRIFSSLDGAWASANEIGFKTATIVANDAAKTDEAFNLT